MAYGSTASYVVHGDVTPWTSLRSAPSFGPLVASTTGPKRIWRANSA